MTALAEGVNSATEVTEALLSGKVYRTSVAGRSGCTVPSETGEAQSTSKDTQCFSSDTFSGKIYL